MRTWASWTAKAALLAAGFAAAGGGLSGAALAASSGSAGSGAGKGSSADQLITPTGVCRDAGAVLGVVGVACQPGASASVPAPGAAGTGWPGTGNSSSGSTPADGSRSPLPADACGSAAAVLGDSTAGCLSGALADATTGRPAAGGLGGGAGSMVQQVVAPVMSVLGATAARRPTSGLAPLSAVGGHPAAPGADSASVNPPGAGAGPGDTNVPAASLAGLGALPGLADLPSLAGLANMPALNGDTGGGIPMPGTALSAANTSGMSSDSFAALAVGALLAGASALKIAGRRARDRKAGIGVAI
jgi:hypothetical protein